MKNPVTRPVILMVDDDAEDIYLTKRAFCRYRENLVFASVQTGDDMFDYLHCRGNFSDNTEQDATDIILLDINIPKENGFDILEKLRADDSCGHIPVCMLTTSAAPHDVQKAYQNGANSYVRKSVSAAEMKKIAENFCNYWFDFVSLP